MDGNIRTFVVKTGLRDWESYRLKRTKVAHQLQKPPETMMQRWKGATSRRG